MVEKFFLRLKKLLPASDIAEMRQRLDNNPTPNGGQVPQGSKGNIRRLTPTQRFRVALDMWEGGEPLEMIRHELGYSNVTSVSRAIQKAKARGL